MYKPNRTHLDVAVSPRRVRCTNAPRNSSDDDEETNGKDGLLVGNLAVSNSLLNSYRLRRMSRIESVVPPSFGYTGCNEVQNQGPRTHVKLSRHGRSSQCRPQNNTTGLCPKAGRRDRVDDGRGFLVGSGFWVSVHVRPPQIPFGSS